MTQSSVTETINVQEPLRLPDEADLATAKQIVASMPEATAQARAQAMAQQGVLRDLAGLLAGDTSDTAIRGKSVANLAEAIECFETLAEIIVSPGPAGGGKSDGAMACPEFRLRDCRVEQADLSSLEVEFPLQLEHCVFTGEVRLLGTHFHQQARFVGCGFLKEANFFAATFQAGANFGGASFHGPADFRGATFDGEISFFRANFDQSLELKFANFEPTATLNLVELRFRGSGVLGGGLSMGRRQFRHGLIVGEDSRDHHSLAAACEQYGELEANFASQGSPDSNSAKDWCHYRYMDLRRRSAYGRWNWRRFMDWLFLKWCFGYGVFTRRILLSGAAVILLFAILYATNGMGMSREHWGVVYGPDNDSSLLPAPTWYEAMANALYFSVITFATVGYGDWHPVHWARLAAALEGLSGVFIMSVFTVSFARKIIR